MLAGMGFARMPPSRSLRQAIFVGYDEGSGDWVEIRVRLDRITPGLVASALGDRISSPLRWRGPSVALIGPDGAGKSSIIAAVGERSYIPARSIYMGLYQGQAGRLLARPGKAGRRPARHIPGVGLALALMRQWERWLIGTYHRLRHRLVLFDRYTYDALLPADRPMSRLGRLRRRILTHACPPPEVAVILDAPAEILYERAGEHDVQTLESHRSTFLKLADRLPQSVVVDTSREVEVAARAVTAATWRAYARRS